MLAHNSDIKASVRVAASSAKHPNPNAAARRTDAEGSGTALTNEI